MSPKKRPLSLNLLCIKSLADRLIHGLSDEEGKHLQEIAVYMSSATFDTLQALLNDILGLINLDASIRFNCLQVLLREDVKNLEIGIFPRFYYDKILEVIRDQGTGLHYLNLKGVWARDFQQLLSDLIANLPHLKSLIIPHMSDDAVINRLLSLKKLVKLDISGEACYTCNGIRQLKSETLRILDIGSFGKPNLGQDSTSGHELVAELIRNLPNLNVLKTYSFTGHSILHLYKKDNNFRTKLTYLHTTDCDMDMLNAIVLTCPCLENVHFNCPENGVTKRLNRIKSLYSLKLTKGDSAELSDFLQLSGQNLQALKLNHTKNGSLDLSELCERTPYLNALECYHLSLKFTNSDSFFMNLQKVQILYCDIGDIVVRNLLMNAPFLKSLSVGSSVNISDGDMFRLLGEVTLENIEELLFSEARLLTAVSVQLLAENCVNLKLLGFLTGWDLTQEEIDALRVLISSSNTDLTLWPAAY